MQLTHSSVVPGWRHVPAARMLPWVRAGPPVLWDTAPRAHVSVVGSSVFMQLQLGAPPPPEVQQVPGMPCLADQVRAGTYQQLFHPKQLLADKEDTANSCARGYYTVNKEIINPMLEHIRELVSVVGPRRLEGLEVGVGSHRNVSRARLGQTRAPASHLLRWQM